MIEVQDVSYGLEGRSILQSVSMNICPGQFTVLMGGNGAGKTTLAKIIKGLLVPTSGKVLMDGTEMAAAGRDYQIKVGIVFQNPENQIVASVVEEDVAFGPENLGLKPNEIRERVESSLKTVGLWDLRHRPVHALSGGQKQRLAIAGILALRPSYILFDEATALLDPVGRKEVLETATILAKSVGVLWITHDLREALQADMLYALCQGRVVFQGSVQEFITNPEAMDLANATIPEEVTLAEMLSKRGAHVDWPLNKENLLKAITSLNLKTFH
ncbi:MAG TPA: ATP-binding cassette domain-containing protein [Coprothermobacter sp.]|nr:ATP-binding cassette domain-containing protein [Coprothermobacter sp.]